MSEPDAPIGENLARIRRARGHTQEELAHAAEVSVDVIARLEQGRKHTARWSTLSALAHALDVELSELVMTRTPLATPKENPALLNLRRALTDIGEMPWSGDFAENESTTSPLQLNETIQSAWFRYQSGEFALLAQLLPNLLADARRLGAPESLASVYHMAAGIAVTLGREDLALHAVEKALCCADGRALPQAASATFGSWVLLKQGRYGDAETVAVRQAEEIEPGFQKGTSEQLALFGHLLINASAAAVRANRGVRAAELLDVAAGAAMRLGADVCSQQSVFGPAVVAMTAVNNAVELGEMDTALQLASTMPKAPRVPATWAARCLLNIAYAAAESGNDVAAVDALWRSRTMAGEWMRYHPLGRAVVRDLLERVSRRTSPRLRTLAAELKVVP
ncbi:MAG: helix-turn-helix transcriptional regulator [Corynebacteriales bacterium]|nr:helix-turn-helix transcriptional regulator [Mycobacteriales bacterium]